MDGRVSLPEGRSSAQRETNTLLLSPTRAKKIFCSFSPQWTVTEKQSRNFKIAKKGLGGLVGGGEDGTYNSPRTPPCGGVTFPSGQEARANTMSSLREVKGLPRSFCGSNTELIA